MKSKVCMAGALALGFAVSAHAQEPAAATPPPAPKGYVGMGVSQNSYKDWSDVSLNVDGSFSNETTDDSAVGFRIFGGVPLSNAFAFEVGYQNLGEVTYEGDSNGCCFFPAGHYTATATATGFDLGVRARGAFTPAAAAILRIGMLIWNADVEANTPVGSGSDSANGNDLVVALGLQYDGWDTAGLRLEYVRYDLDDEHIDSLGAALVFRLN